MQASPLACATGETAKALGATKIDFLREPPVTDAAACFWIVSTIHVLQYWMISVSEDSYLEF